LPNSLRQDAKSFALQFASGGMMHDALAQIAEDSQIPVIADIHFQPKYTFAAIDAGCAAVAVNCPEISSNLMTR
jgi:4-hydroxy-3-methylbut-2-en-1-yl diphosphate synthase IspG/GcpE